MNKLNFIRTSDAETISKLKQLGFQVLEETNNYTTFLNHTKKKLDFDDKKVVYTNKLNM